MEGKAASLRRRLHSGKILRIVGAHNGLGARLIEQHHFDGVWASGLEISTAYGLPDANILTMTENLEAARAINDATRLPVICDCDTGYGNASNVKHLVRRYEAAGLAAIVIEDKQFPKVNSFVHGRQKLVTVEEFTGKIRAAKEVQQGSEFLVFARVEALIAGFGPEEALRRAHAYAEAGADGIVIHSKASTPDEVFAFAREWQGDVPLVAIPTSYFRVTAEELQGAGFSMVIYANHGLRATIQTLHETLKAIDESGTTAGIEERIASLQEVFEIQGMNDLREDEKKFLRQSCIQAVIPAARDHRFQPELKELLRDKPLCMVPIAGKTLLERQLDLLHSTGVQDVRVVGGHLYEKIHAEGVQLLYNANYARGGCAQSIMLAADRLHEDALVVYSDILFDRRILERLLESPHDATLVIDRAYRSLPVREKPLDLVIVEERTVQPVSRRLDLEVFRRIRSIGQGLKEGEASHEFIGLALFRRRGLQALRQVWEEASNVEQADLTDLLRRFLEQGTPLYGMEIEQGWTEIHSLDDYKRVLEYFERKPVAVPTGRPL